MMAKRGSQAQNTTTIRAAPFFIPFLGFLLRLVPLGRYVTPDEPAWVYRAIRLTDALAARDWTAVPVTGHPGATTMWLGALGVAARRLLDPPGSAVHLDFIRRTAWLAPENGEPFRHLAYFLSPGRVAVALVTALGLSILYQLLARRFDRRIALLTVGLLAFDPFLFGHSGLLHTDALLATFCLLALAAGLNGLQEPRQATWWVLCGVFTGLALLTKTPALILIPAIALFIAIGHHRAAIDPQPPPPRPSSPKPHSSSFIVNSSFFIVHSSLFIATTAITLFALYPALWSNPAEILRTLSAFVFRHIETAQRPIFFAGRMTYDPGWAFYPVVLIFRFSPIVLIGLVVGLINLRRLPSDRRLAFLLLLAFGRGLWGHDEPGSKETRPLPAACYAPTHPGIRHSGRLGHRQAGGSAYRRADPPAPAASTSQEFTSQESTNPESTNLRSHPARAPGPARPGLCPPPPHLL